MTLDDDAMIALLQATYDSAQALAKQHEASERRAEEELAVLRTERDLLLRRVAALEAAHSDLQRTRAQLGDALRRAARAEMDAEVARSRLMFRLAKMLLEALRALAQRRVAALPSILNSGLLRDRGSGVVLVDIVGWAVDDLGPVLDRLAERRDADGTVMILLTDCDRFDLFRARGLVFEYLADNTWTRDERIAELSVAYRLDSVLVAADDPALTGDDGDVVDRVRA
jgi:multidrug efflux pump subunit AcrA (membrane-fusion protein)